MITEGGKYNKIKQSAKVKRKMKFEVNKELQTKNWTQNDSFKCNHLLRNKLVIIQIKTMLSVNNLHKVFVNAMYLWQQVHGSSGVYHSTTSTITSTGYLVSS